MGTGKYRWMGSRWRGLKYLSSGGRNEGLIAMWDCKHPPPLTLNPPTSVVPAGPLIKYNQCPAVIWMFGLEGPRLFYYEVSTWRCLLRKHKRPLLFYKWIKNSTRPIGGYCNYPRIDRAPQPSLLHSAPPPPPNKPLGPGLLVICLRPLRTCVCVAQFQHIPYFATLSSVRDYSF